MRYAGLGLGLVAFGCLSLLATCSVDTTGLTGSDGGRASGGSNATGGVTNTGGTSTGGSGGGVVGSGGTNASGGAGGSGGRVASGGSGSGGRVGSGTGGVAQTGGSGSGGHGTGGVVSAKPECTRASDCHLISDCCTCKAVPDGTKAAECQLSCKEDKCEQLSLPDDAVDCVAGRCVAGFNCDGTKVSCDAAGPACIAGDVPGITGSGTCYTGACVPTAQCKRVSSCAVCSSVQACVSYQLESGPRLHCVTVPTTCSGNAASCACLGESSCVSPNLTCTALSGVRGVACSCPNC